MGTPEKPVQLKVFVDKKKKKVMFAEAEEDFVDILFSFFTLPLGTIAKLLREHSDPKDTKIGSLTSLYESVVNLNEDYFKWWHIYRDAVNSRNLLVNTKNSSAYLFQRLKVNLEDTSRITSVTGNQGVFVKSLAKFIVTDDLSVLPATLETSVVLFNSLGVGNINLLEERTMYFGSEEFLNLFKWSLLTNNPLTNLVLSGRKPCSSCATNSTLMNSSATMSSNSGKTQTLKLLVQKSNKSLLCAQADNLFVELLFSFLTIPLGAVIRLTKDGSSPSGISNLYDSISCLGDGKHVKYDDVKTLLLCPKLASDYLRTTDFLPIYEVNKPSGHFLREETLFVVFNDLEVIGSSPMATFSKFNTLGVPVGDMELLEVGFGEHEALQLLKASLTSTSALTDFLNASRKKPKAESST